MSSYRRPAKPYSIRWWVETITLVAALTWLSTFFWAKDFSEKVYYWVALPGLAVVFVWDLWDLIKGTRKSKSEA